jgi:cbb3-type cytochrome c oxidase subunit III
MTREQSWMGFLATGLLLVTLGLLIIREPVLQARATDAQLTEAITHGTDIYLENCVVCHGAEGEGLGAYPALDIASTMDADTLAKVIERGRYGTQMAAYGVDEGGILSASNIEHLVALIQHGDWQNVYAIADERDLIPPEMVVAEIPEEMLTDVQTLPDGDLLAEGLTLYAENCASCHGVNMEGTTLAPALNTEEVRYTESYEIARIIEQGVPGTLMASWDNALDDRQVDATVALILRWQEIESLGVEIPVVEAEPIDMSPEAIARGSQLFDITCASCHGVNAYGSPMAPALNNDLFLGTTSDAQMRQIIAMGVSGTVMPAWGGRFNDAQMNDIIAYLRSLEANAPTITAPIR